jgi:hypothetical protein
MLITNTEHCSNSSNSVELFSLRNVTGTKSFIKKLVLRSYGA